jgi:predicted ribosomally synthesized peptide with SipW-like signal peptide
MSAKLTTAASLTAIAAVAAAIGTGTYAHFSDTEDVENYGVTAGSINLALTNDSGSESTPFVLTHIQPGNGSSKVINVTNSGNLDSLVTASIVNVSSAENGCLEPESSSGDTSCPTLAVPAPASELDDQLRLSITVPDDTLDTDTSDADIDGDVGTDPDVVYSSAAVSDRTTPAFVQRINNQQALAYTVTWSLPSDAGNSTDNNQVMSDSVEFDVKFDAVTAVADATQGTATLSD